MAAILSPKELHSWAWMTVSSIDHSMASGGWIPWIAFDVTAATPERKNACD